MPSTWSEQCHRCIILEPLFKNHLKNVQDGKLKAETNADIGYESFWMGTKLHTQEYTLCILWINMEINTIWTGSVVSKI